MDALYLFNTGENSQSYKSFGALPARNEDGVEGYTFQVYAPRARKVNVIGDFNDWDTAAGAMSLVGETGVWQLFLPGAKQWMRYKYRILTAAGRWIEKSDPFARHAETRPATASILYDPDDYDWNDTTWQQERLALVSQPHPLNIYELHVGSWRRYPDNSPFSYRHLADELAPYLRDMGFNAVEIMPVMEYPLDDSWGYQVTGYFAVSSRYGTPADFKYFVDVMHRQGIAVIMDWVAAHFPKDAHGLALFDGEPLFEPEDVIMANQPEWGTLCFDYGRQEVQSFLISNAWFWLAEFHLDGLRYDAVSAMLYRNFGRANVSKNKFGNYDNLEAIQFLCKINGILRRNFPACYLIAEESTSWPYVTKSIEEGGLGFTHKWNMGWMNDTLKYFSLDYLYRHDHHSQLTFSMMYAFSERFVLPFSHDEVVHGKCSLLGRMAGDPWRQFASLRTLFMYQIVHPGAKLNFMGNEFAPYIEWRFAEELEWFLLEYDNHSNMQKFVQKLNKMYLERRSLWELDCSWDGFKWLQADDATNSVFGMARESADGEEIISVILNLTPAVHERYLVKAPKFGIYRVLLNSDDPCWSGSGYLCDYSEGLLVQTTIATLAEAKVRQQEQRHKESQSKAANKAEDTTIDFVECEPEVSAITASLQPYFELRLPPLAGLVLEYLGEPSDELKMSRGSRLPRPRPQV